ncbi:MAG: transcription elongation factor GreA [Candidatus Omnitrophica bacterium]|nr:transcription elongation factor GreA [Candidatus Omnitrophota bacterium]
MGYTYLTKAGLHKLQDELKALQRQRRELIEEVERARGLGDLRENAEYHAARERLQHVTQRLSELDAKLTQVQLIDDLPVAQDEARIGVQVTLRDLQTKDEFSYVLVGSEEADPQNGKLSIESPLGKNLLGKKKGERFTLALPKSIVPYLVLDLKRST